jgi:hypothetical protein
MSMRFFRPVLTLPILALPLLAQMPPGWKVQRPLGADAPAGSWFGVGTWSADRHGPSATFTDSLGLGNALTGTGVHLEGGWKAGRLDLAAQWLAVHSPTGADYLTLYRGHLAWRGRWQAGLEMEPLVWGYGLNGGYLLGQASRPFPRIRVESPMVDLRPFKVPLGRWGFQVFLGRLENHRTFSDSLQNRLQQVNLAAAQGDPQAPLLSGYRLQAEFSDFMEFYANYLNLWGGTRNGRSMLQGYGLGDYATAMFGLKDSLAEAHVDPNSGQVYNPVLVNKAQSSSVADVGFRVRSRPLERLLGAEGVHGYYARGSKSMGSSFGLLRRNPAKYGGRDLDNEFQRFIHFRVMESWRDTGRYTSPNLTSPNETVGALVAWRRLRVGLEYLDAINRYGAGEPQVRPWNNSIYLSGFYTYGDPLGNAVGGEARTTTLRVEAEFSDRWSGTTLLRRGIRPFRDDLALWQAAHPGLAPVTDAFLGLQQSLAWRIRPGLALEAGASWERHGAVDNLPGARKNGFRWYSDLSCRWPVAGR